MPKSLGHIAERHRDSCQRAGITTGVRKGFLGVHLRPLLDVPRSFLCLCRHGITNPGTASPSSLLGECPKGWAVGDEAHNVYFDATPTTSASYSSSRER